MRLIVNTIILKVQGMMNKWRLRRGAIIVLSGDVKQVYSPTVPHLPPITDRISAVIGGQMINIAVTVGALVTAHQHQHFPSPPPPSCDHSTIDHGHPGPGTLGNTSVQCEKISIPSVLLNKYIEYDDMMI